MTDLVAVLTSIHNDLAALDGRLQSVEGKLNRALGMALGDAHRDIKMSKTLERIIKTARANKDASDALIKMYKETLALLREAAEEGDPAILAQIDMIDAQTEVMVEAALEGTGTPFDPSAN